MTTQFHATRDQTVADLLYRLTELQSDLHENRMREAAAAVGMALAFVIEGTTYEFTRVDTAPTFDTAANGTRTDAANDDGGAAAAPLLAGRPH